MQSLLSKFNHFLKGPTSLWLNLSVLTFFLVSCVLLLVLYLTARCVMHRLFKNLTYKLTKHRSEEQMEPIMETYYECQLQRKIGEQLVMKELCDESEPSVLGLLWVGLHALLFTVLSWLIALVALLEIVSGIWVVIEWQNQKESILLLVTNIVVFFVCLAVISFHQIHRTNRRLSQDCQPLMETIKHWRRGQTQGIIESLATKQ